MDSEVIRIDHKLVDSRMDEALITQVATMLELEMPNLLQANFFAVSSNRQDAFDYYLNGNGYLEKFEDVKNIDTAIRFFNLALDIDRNFTLAHAGLGRAFWLKYEETKDITYVSQAINACQTAMDLNGHYSESFLTCGTIYKGTGHYDLAVQKLERAIELDPAYAQAYWRLGETYLALGDTSRAMQTYQQAIDIRPGYWQGYSRLGKYYINTGQYDKAIGQYQRVADLLPNNERGYYFLAIAHFYSGNMNQAIQMAEKAVQIEPSYSNLYNLASFHYYDGNYQAASVAYKKVLEYNQTDHRIWDALGISYYFTNREDSAKIFFRTAVELVKGELEINPKKQVNLVSLAGYYAYLGLYMQAEELLNRVENMNPVNLNIIFAIGDVYEHIGNRDKALFWMEKALKNNYGLAKFTNNPGLKDLMADEEFQNILRKYQLDDQQ
jgi:tetratricopeptide (TPR) repeat protein